MTMRRFGPLARRLVTALVLCLLALPLAPKAATAGSGTDEVDVPADLPTRQVIRAVWFPETGVRLEVPDSAPVVHLSLPTEVGLVPSEEIGSWLDGYSALPRQFLGSAPEAVTLDGTDVWIDLPSAIAAIQGTSPTPPGSLRFGIYSLDGAADRLDLVAHVELVASAASAQVDIALDLSSGTALQHQATYFDTAPVIAGAGTTIVFDAVPGFWGSPGETRTIQIFGERGNVTERSSFVSADGSPLRHTITDSWFVFPVLSTPVSLEVSSRHSNGSWTVVRVPLISAATDVTEAYITSAYWDLFGRSPDPSGLAGWTRALHSGTPYGAVADGITYSPEFRGRLITDAYASYLGREPDSAGLSNWLRAMEHGMQIQQMESGFLSSPEYYAQAGSNDAAWVAALYSDVLGRDPDSSEVRGWLPVVSGHGRSAVALGFLNSTEHLTTVVDEYYEWLLARHLDPSGQQTWVRAIQAGTRTEAIIAGIIASAEYRAKAPTATHPPA